MVNLHIYPSPFLNESRILREANTLAGLRIFDRIELVGTSGDRLPRTQAVAENIAIHRIGKESGRKLPTKVIRFIAWYLMIYRRYRHAPVSCINCHSVSTLPLGVMLKSATGARLVYDAHELETETNNLRGVRKLAVKVIERVLIKEVDHCIFVSDAIENWYIHAYGQIKTAVVYNCPKWQAVTANNHFREVFGIPEERRIFLYQGILAEGRGLRILVETFACLKNRAALVVMGFGPLTDWLKAAAAKHDNVHYHPAVPPHELLTFTSAADFGLSIIEATSLSYEYCMPNKLFEYIMAGLPVLVSSTTEQKHVVERYGLGEVAAETSVSGVRNAALRLLESDSATLREGIETARRNFSWDRQERVIRRIYGEGLGFQCRGDLAEQ